jgi:hypothetical protein
VELSIAAPATRTARELAESYEPPPHTAALVTAHEGISHKAGIAFWLVSRAIEALGRQVGDDEAGGHWLTRDLTEIRWGRRKLIRIPAEHVVLRDPFNPDEGAFSKNTRWFTEDGLDELRESMRHFGWLKELPAYRDERGVVLIGHRRLAAAKDLGIEPIIRTLRLGNGDTADAARFALAIASNLGNKPLTAADRRRMAEYLYGERQWSQEQIAKTLMVSQATISNDLARLITSDNFSRPRRAGRPRGEPKPRFGATKRVRTPALDEEVIKRYAEFGGEEYRDGIAADLGIGKSTVQTVIDEERARRTHPPCYPLIDLGHALLDETWKDGTPRTSDEKRVLARLAADLNVVAVAFEKEEDHEHARS